MVDKDETKIQKKLAKAKIKSAKKLSNEVDQPVPVSVGSGDPSPSERSAAAAEKQLSLHRWKVIFAAISTLIALVALVVMLLK